jgi:hypothetical protein
MADSIVFSKDDLGPAMTHEIGVSTMKQMRQWQRADGASQGVLRPS